MRIEWRDEDDDKNCNGQDCHASSESEKRERDGESPNAAPRAWKRGNAVEAAMEV